MHTMYAEYPALNFIELLKLIMLETQDQTKNNSSLNIHGTKNNAVLIQWNILTSFDI